MIYTSSYFNYEFLKNKKLYSVSLSIPDKQELRGLDILSLNGFKPTWDMYRYLKNKQLSFKGYSECYIDLLNKRLKYKNSDIIDNIEVIKKLEKEPKDSLLLCWEQYPKNCHRSILAEWLIKECSIEIQIR